MGLLSLAIPTPYKIIAGLVLCITIVSFSAYKGYSYGVMKEEKKIADYKAQLTTLNADLNIAKVNIQIQVITKYVDRVVTIHDVVVKNHDVIRLVPDTGILSKGWVAVHNGTVLGLPVETAAASDATPSGVAANEALGTVVTNYGSCQDNQAKLDALQEYVTVIKSQVDTYNKKLGSLHLK